MGGLRAQNTQLNRCCDLRHVGHTAKRAPEALNTCAAPGDCRYASRAVSATTTQETLEEASFAVEYNNGAGLDDEFWEAWRVRGVTCPCMTKQQQAIGFARLRPQGDGLHRKF